MKRVLLYIESDILVYDISTHELEEKAWLSLFNEFGLMGFYGIMVEPRQKELCTRALAGDADAAKSLLYARKSYESENFYIRTVSE